MSEFNIKYMEKALELAREAFQDDEVPVGAVIVRNGEIVATGRNRREKEKNALYTQKPTQLTMPVRRSAVGGFGTAIYM